MICKCNIDSGQKRLDSVPAKSAADSGSQAGFPLGHQILKGALQKMALSRFGGAAPDRRVFCGRSEEISTMHLQSILSGIMPSKTCAFCLRKFTSTRPLNSIGQRLRQLHHQLGHGLLAAKFRAHAKCRTQKDFLYANDAGHLALNVRATRSKRLLMPTP